MYFYALQLSQIDNESDVTVNFIGSVEGSVRR